MSSVQTPRELDHRPSDAVRPSSTAWPIGVSMMPFTPVGDLSSYASGGPAPWRPALREAAAAGFAHIDLTDSWVRPGDLTREQLVALRDDAAEYGLSFSAISVTRQSVIDPDPRVAQANLEYSIRTVEAAPLLGVEVVCLGLHQPLTAEQQSAQWFWHVTGAEDPADDAVRQLAVERFRQVGERAAEIGVTISLEMYEGTYLGTSADAIALVQDIGLANVGLNPDIGNIIRLHRPVEQWQEMLAAMLPYTNYWHVKNYLRDFDPSTGAYFTAPAPLELGYINYRQAIDMALKSGFDGPFCVEHYGGDGLSISAVNRDYLRRILAVKMGE